VNIAGLKYFKEVGGNIDDIDFMFSGSTLAFLAKKINLSLSDSEVARGDEKFNVCQKYKNIL